MPKTDFPVSLVWMAVFSFPEGMEGWQAYRIEYGGHATDCVYEGMVWLPPDVDPDVIERAIRGEIESGV